MLRINLIPPEILQSRRDEGVFQWIMISGVLIILVMVTFWGVMYMNVISSANEVASIEKQDAELQTKISSFTIFEQQQKELNNKKSIVAAAEAGRIDWATMFSELGFVLPSNIYLTSFTGTEDRKDGNSMVTLSGEVVDKTTVVKSEGSKSLASMLVRLNNLKEFDSVWLTNLNLTDNKAADATMQWSASAKLLSSTPTTPTVN